MIQGYDSSHLSLLFLLRLPVVAPLTPTGDRVINPDGRKGIRRSRDPSQWVIKSEIGCDGPITRPSEAKLIMETKAISLGYDRILSMTTRLRIGQWNVRTLRETSRLAQLEMACSKNDVGILGISEMRWCNAGEIQTINGNVVLFSGNQNAAENGVGFLIAKKFKNSLISWLPINDRIIVARFRCKFRNITIIQCYAPTETASTEHKDEFYQLLYNTIDKVKKGDILIVMGDMNAKVGSDNSLTNTVMGKHGIGVMNDNGERLVELCQQAKLVIGGTIFPHKDIHKYTWTAPNRKTKNQIDHICVSRAFRSSLHDVRTRRGADIDSDHQLLIAELKCKLKKNFGKPIESRQKRKINFENLEVESIRSTYVCKIKNELRQHKIGSFDDWERAQQMYLDIATETLGTTSKKRKEWISDNTWKHIEERRRLRLAILNEKDPEVSEQLQTRYNEKSKQVKTNARKDKRKFYENIATEAQEAADKHDLRQTYIKIKQLSGRWKCNIQPIEDEHGNLITSVDKQRERWKEYFESMLSTENHGNVQDNSEGSSDMPVVVRESNAMCQPPSRSEIIKIIKEMKNNKAAGIDGLKPELLKYELETAADMLHPLLKLVWEKEEVPEAWKMGMIVKIPKKGNLKKCDNWRGITLLNLINKLLANILLNRIQGRLDPLLRENQAGFRRNRSCIDQANTLRLIIEQSREWNSPLYLVFVDFEKAFDSIHRSAIWTALASKGIPEKLIRMIQALYSDSRSAILHSGKLSDSFRINNGVRQGCPLSPLLFILTLDIMLEKVEQETRKEGIRWSLVDHLGGLEYADDVCILAHSRAAAQKKLNCLNYNANKIGLKINIKKTKVMRIKSNNNEPLVINNHVLEEVSSFCYLGCMMSTDGGSDEDIESKIKKARSVFGELRKIWRSKQITRNSKIQIFNSCVKAVLLYGSESWNSKRSSISKLQTFVNKSLRIICGIFWPRKVSNAELWESCKQTPLEIEIKKRRWSWIGHILRKHPNSIPRVALEWNPQGCRKRGRPRMSWRRSVLLEAGTSWSELKKMATNRVRWKAFVEALCSPVE